MREPETQVGNDQRNDPGARAAAAELRDTRQCIAAPDHFLAECGKHPVERQVDEQQLDAADQVIEGVGVAAIDVEGRYLRADFGNLSVISIYLPSGSSGEHRQAAKFFFMQQFFPILKQLAANGREIILCGDWNIAHQQIDLKNWRSNQKNSGFLPEERAWLSGVFDQLGWVDVFRRINPEPEQYTWWSNRGQAWAKNVGWRIDYQIATPAIASKATQVSIYKTERFSDHSPLIIDYDYSL
ncbi:MAG: exodeoxyribonuclease III [Pseudomonadota bacterium]